MTGASRLPDADPAGWTPAPSPSPSWLEGPDRREGSHGAHSSVLLRRGEEAFPAPFGTQKGISRLGRGWATGRGAEAIASRGRARPAKCWPLALWTRRGSSPPGALNCPQEPNCTTRLHPTAPSGPQQPPCPKSPEERPGHSPQLLSPCPSPRGWTPAMEPRQALSAQISDSSWVRVLQ